MALRVATARDPLDIPGGIEDTTLQRWMGRVRDVVRNIQTRPRVRVVSLRLEPTGSSVPEFDVIPYVDRDVKITSAHWSQATSLSASSSNYWTFYLRQGQVGAQQPTATLGKVDSQDGLGANVPLEFSLASPIVRAARRVTLEVTETGTADTLGPGVLLLYCLEVD